ncbi:MAG: threonine synthase [Candidatus Caldarchaeum sp.]|uniref:Threonine synthase n=1 Tax=Caldiarchaeum subterraneum TaxID=311458 RepID=A0A7C4HZ50_CALS0
MFVKKMVCSRCQTEYNPLSNPILCRNNDNGRLDIVYDYDRVAESFSKSSIEKRVPRGVWRYWELIPVDQRYASPLCEGNTPLLHAQRLGGELGVRRLFLKDETRNPTASFKDRAMAVGAAKAVEMDRKDVVIASSGNAASSLAAYSASLGLRCTAFVPEDVAMGKASQLLLYGARVLRVKQVEEGRDPTVDLMMQTVKELGWYPCPSFGPFNPYQVEGPKTIVYEMVEQMGWSVPDFVFIPTGSGCLATGIWKALKELRLLGLIENYPKMVPVQPSGNMSLVRAILQGKSFEEVEPEKWPKSIASGLLDPYPWDGDAAIEGVRTTGGTAVAVEEEEIRDAVKKLARLEGVFAEPSGAVGVAAVQKLLEQGVLDASDTVVVLVTASGLKEPEKIASTAELPLIQPALSELMRYLS